MRVEPATWVAWLAALCGGLGCGTGGPSQSGPIGGCAGVSLQGPGGFSAQGGMVYQHPVQLGTGQILAGAQVVVLWGGAAPDSGLAFASACGTAHAQGFPTSLALGPASLAINLPDTLASGGLQTAVIETLQAQGSGTELADPAAGVSLGNVAGTCLSGSLNATVYPANPLDQTAIDGGVPLALTGSFDLPRCK